MDGAAAKGHPKDKLTKIWNDWKAFAQYAFNKSHSTCYAFVAYQTAYLKAHYPAEYMAAVLNNAGNIEKAIEGYRQIKKEKPDNAAVSQGRLNGLGYGFLRAKKLPEALAYFKLNVEFYPNESNVYDSLGEAYMAQGEKELAIANYKKSLELDPKNKNAVEMLKKLGTPSN